MLDFLEIKGLGRNKAFTPIVMFSFLNKKSLLLNHYDMQSKAGKLCPGF